MKDVYQKIMDGELPTSKIYEDEETFAFLDIHPHNKGHTLVTPKRYFKNILDVDEKAWQAVMETVRKLAPVIQKTLGADGLNININNEAAAGQEVPRLHVHIVPRFENDGVYQGVKHTRYAPGEKDQLAETIRKELSQQ